MRIQPAGRVRGRLTVPGDKSVSHRAAIVAALARGRTRARNFASSADCASTLACLRSLGVEVRRDGADVFVEGAGRGPGLWAFREPRGPLDCGNSGTTMRLLAGVLAAQPFAATLVGDESLSRRPMGRVMAPLGLMGARLEAVEGHAPLRVEGRSPLNAVEYESPVASAQVKSCVLLAGLGAAGRTRVVEPSASRDHTERMLRWFGVEVEEETAEGGRHAVAVGGAASFDARDVDVPGDISSAAFFAAAAAMLPGSELTIEAVGLNPTRAQILDTLRGLGADVTTVDAREVSNEPVGDVRVRGAGGLAPVNEGARVLRGAEVAVLIDELPVLAVLGTQVEGGLEIRDARELRVKESDRIGTTVANLRLMGAEVEEFGDGLKVNGPVRLRGARLKAYGDHRIAMAFAVAALAAEGETEIEGAEECVPVSFPEFFPSLGRVTER
ncbi:MAG TPA: 3-phosphoshikimate 1-carboxyvinyltransferase [Pyrinomonadaceae bacterium]|jgi:3-phosphoshikimate 1-carboxyvinyltransferase|nr:3-phosphoshikimate 1-carboxyvinyltransferase [Pyrinomonadaceae bacterium]